MHLATIAFALLAPVQDKFEYSEWDAWNSFGVGAAVEHETDAGGMKMKMSTTILKKEADKITVKTVTKMKAGDMDIETPSEREITKPKAADLEATKDMECPMCKKKYSEHKDEGKWSKEKIKIGDKDVECTVYETSGKMCNGEAAPKTKIYYSKDVPGYMVQQISDAMKMNCLSFDPKK